MHGTVAEKDILRIVLQPHKGEAEKKPGLRTWPGRERHRDGVIVPVDFRGFESGFEKGKE